MSQTFFMILYEERRRMKRANPGLKELGLVYLN